MDYEVKVIKTFRTNIQNIFIERSEIDLTNER